MSDTAFLTRAPLLRSAGIPWPRRDAAARCEPSGPASKSWSIPSFPDDGTLGDLIARSDSAAITQVAAALFPPMAQLARALGPQQRSESELAGLMIAAVVRRVQRQPLLLASLGNWAVKVGLRAGERALETSNDHLGVKTLDRDQISGAARHVLPGDSSDPETAAQAQALLRTLLLQLPAAHRLVFHLVEVEGWAAHAIVQYTGWPSWLVRWRVFRAQRKFRRLLSHAIGEGFRNFVFGSGSCFTVAPSPKAGR